VEMCEKGALLGALPRRHVPQSMFPHLVVLQRSLIASGLRGPSSSCREHHKISPHFCAEDRIQATASPLLRARHQMIRARVARCHFSNLPLSQAVHLIGSFVAASSLLTS